MSASPVPDASPAPGRRPAGRSPRRPTLQYRTAQVTIGVAAVAVLVAGIVLLSLVRSAEDSDARRTLSALADAAADAADRPTNPAPGRTRALAALKVDFAYVTRQGRTVAGQSDGLAAQALTPAEAASVAAGQSLSLTRDVAGVRTLVEARPVRRGALVLAQPLSEAAPLERAVVRIGLALLIGLAVAATAGILLARLLGRPLRRAAQAAHAMAAGARDVRLPPEGPAEVAEVADSLNRLSAALTTSEGRQREFLLSVSHELRTPLTAISGFAESLADGVTSAEDVRPVGQTMLGEARRLDRLVSDLLDLARLGARDFRIDRQPVDLAALVASAAEVWRARCEAVGVAFHAELPPLPLVADTDPTRVRQVIDGLAENALRVTPSGAPIVLALHPAPGTAVLQVRDGGPGLTPEDCAVAFERSVLYERYRGVRRVGTGVGLALVHGLITRLGGTAEAGRAPEGGACFTVRLPLAAPPWAATIPLAGPAAGSAAAGRTVPLDSGPPAGGNGRVPPEITSVHAPPPLGGGSGEVPRGR